MIYIPRFIKIDSSIKKLMAGGGSQTQNEENISLLLFFQNKESVLKNLSNRP
jgi:hypothetical protein